MQSLFPDDTSTSDQEVSAFLDAAGCDLDQLRARLIEAAQGFGAAERREQRAAPPYLKDLVDSLRQSASLPRNPLAAASRAKEWLTGLMQQVPAPGALRIVEAYRKDDGDLTEEDKKALDAIGDELRREVEGDGEKPRR